MGLIPGQGTQIPQAVCCGQKTKNKNLIHLFHLGDSVITVFNIKKREHNSESWQNQFPPIN